MFIQDFSHKYLQQGYIIAKVGTTQMPNWRLINQTWSVCDRTQFSHKRDEVLLIRILFAKWNQMDTKDNMISLCEMPRIGKFTETQSPGEEGMEVIVQWVQSFCLGWKGSGNEYWWGLHTWWNAETHLRAQFKSMHFIVCKYFNLKKEK